MGGQLTHTYASKFPKDNAHCPYGSLVGAPPRAKRESGGGTAPTTVPSNLMEAKPRTKVAHSSFLLLTKVSGLIVGVGVAGMILLGCGACE